MVLTAIWEVEHNALNGSIARFGWCVLVAVIHKMESSHVKVFSKNIHENS